MPLTAQQQAQLDAMRAKYGLPPRTQRLPVNARNIPQLTRDPNWGNLLGPTVNKAAGLKGGNISDLNASVGRGLDPAGITRGTFGNLGAGLKEGLKSALDPAGVFSNTRPKSVKGTIDPTTGTVTVSNYKKYQQDLSNAYTNYLRTGEVGQLTGGSGAFKKLKQQIADLRASGWQYNPQAQGAPTPNTGPNFTRGLPVGGSLPAQPPAAVAPTAPPPTAAPRPTTGARQPQATPMATVPALANGGRLPGYANGGKVYDRKPNGKRC